MIVGFLQNAYFHNAERVSGYDKVTFRRVWMYALRLSNTGLKLTRAFGEELFDSIYWDNCSPRIGQKSSDCFEPDYDYMSSVLAEQQPELVVAFGSIAQIAVPLVFNGEIIYCRHPAGRSTTSEELCQAAQEIQSWLKRKSSPFPRSAKTKCPALSR